MKRLVFNFVLLISLTVPQLLISNNANTVFAKGKDVGLYDLVSNPQKYKKKKITVRGDFYAFSGLALDYPKAMRSSDEHIGILLSRPDFENIPLVALKLAYPLKEFKKNEDFATISHGDRLELELKVFSTALGEPWADIKDIKILKKKKKDEDNA